MMKEQLERERVEDGLRDTTIISAKTPGRDQDHQARFRAAGTPLGGAGAGGVPMGGKGANGCDRKLLGVS